MTGEYDAIVVGTGAGGGTLALHLAEAGKNILILERGPFLPQEKLNWDTSAVFLDNRYHTKETWQDKDGKPLHPQQAYFVGGQTRVYGAAMFRMRAEDFGVIQHHGGISPGWPITYADMEPFYCQAENQGDPLASKCVRCDTCDGYPCLVHAKSDADINCIRKIMHFQRYPDDQLPRDPPAYQQQRHGGDCG